MKKSKLGIYAIFTLAAIQLPTLLQSTWDDIFSPQQEPAAEEVLASIGQELDRLQQPRVSWLDHVTVDIPNEVAPLLEQLEQRLQKISRLYNEKDPVSSSKKIILQARWIVLKIIKPFLYKKSNVLYPQEEKIIDALTKRLKEILSKKDDASPLQRKNELQDGITRAIDDLKQFHQQARKDLTRVIIFLGDLKARLMLIKSTSVKSKNLLDITKVPIKQMAKDLTLSPYNKKLLNDLSNEIFDMATIEVIIPSRGRGVYLKNKIPLEDIQTIIELITQARRALSPKVLGPEPFFIEEEAKQINTDTQNKAILEELIDSLAQASEHPSDRRNAFISTFAKAMLTDADLENIINSVLKKFKPTKKSTEDLFFQRIKYQRILVALIGAISDLRPEEKSDIGYNVLNRIYDDAERKLGSIPGLRPIKIWTKPNLSP